jgi:hypothetical protein
LRRTLNFDSLPMEPEHRFVFFTFYDHNLCIHDVLDAMAFGKEPPNISIRHSFPHARTARPFTLSK